jgi:arylsulfatase
MITRRAFCAAPAFLQTLSRSRPNLLLLMSDQHRGDCLGEAGHPCAETPNLDRLAREGVRFNHAYSSTPTCTPARSALLTGQSPWNHGMLGYGRGAVRYANELPRNLREAGYYTFGIGKMHWHPQRNAHGFHQVLLDESGRVESPEYRSDYRAWFHSEAPHLDPDATGIGWNDHQARPYVLPERLHPTRWTGDCAVRFLDSYARAEPFFLKVSFARPHSPYDPPQRFWDRYASASIPAPATARWSEKYSPLSSPANDLWHGDKGADTVRHSRRGYYGSVSFVDEQIGRVLEVLDRRRLLEETVILYISDHGDMTGDHHLWRKSYAYEPSSRIPFLLRAPGQPRGTVNPMPVEIRDVLPTFLDAAGALPERGIDGLSLLRKDARRDWIDLEHDICYSPDNHWSAATDGVTKYIFHARDGSEQLFDLATGPLEQRDLAGEANAAARLRLWRTRLTEHLAPRGEAFVSGGRMARRVNSQLYSPNFPNNC